MSLITAGGRQPLNDSQRQAFRDAAAACAASNFPASGTASFKAEIKRYKRRLPSGAKTHVVEDLGVIATQSVGSTAYTTGYHVYLHRLGADESVSGSATIRLEVADDGTLRWAVQPLSSWNADKFTSGELHEMLLVVDGLKHTDEVDYMFHVHGCVEPLLITYERKVKGHERAIEQMKGLLKDPREPKTVFVTKEEAKADKGYHRPREEGNPRDVAEYEERRLWWRTNLQRHKDKLEDLTTGPAMLRYEMLKRMRAAYNRWSGADQEWIYPKSKRRKPPLIKRRLIDMLEAARHPGGSVIDEINDVEDVDD